MQVTPREPLLHRLDLELPLAHILEIFGRPKEHVDERAEERRNEPEHRCHRHEPWILDPPASVLVDPVRDREPEHPDEEERQVPDHEPGPRREEVVEPAENVA